MATAWQGLSKPRPVQGSRTGLAIGVSEADQDILHLCDTIVVNDLKEEYYYSVNDVALDAFQAHLKVVERDGQKYAEIIRLMRPVSLESHKVIAALYLWTRKIDRKLAQELLGEVRPSWKLTFFTALRKAPEYAKINGHWNRSVRTMVRKVIEGTPPYFVMKYADKLRPVVAHAHLKEDAKTQWLFKKKQASEIQEYIHFKSLKEAVATGQLDTIRQAITNVNLPYTIMLGLLGGWSTKPEIAKALLRVMTPWETVLSLRKIEKTGLNLSDSETLDLIMKKVTGAKLQSMKIDPVEIYQAYNKIENKDLQLILRIIIAQQVRTISETINAKIGPEAKVAVVFDVSGSMQAVAEWSLMLAYAIGNSISNAHFIAFSDRAYNLDELVANHKDALSAIIALRERWNQISGGTALGKGLMAGLSTESDVIFYISDFEGNIAPWSDIVYRDYKALHGKFPSLISIKATASPWTATGEPTALRTGRWLGIPEELPVTVRNLWDLPTILEYVLNLLPILRKKGLLKESVYVS